LCAWVAARRALRPCTPSFFSLLRQRKEAKRKAGLLRSPLACGEGFPALLEDRPRPELAAFTSFTLLKQTGRARRDACLRHAGRSSVLLGGADGGKQPAAENRTARHAAGCLAVGAASRLRRRGAEEPKSACRRHATLLARPVCLSVESAANAASSGRLLGSEHRREPFAQQRASAVGSPFFAYFLWRSKESRSAAGTTSRRAAPQVRKP
jgi:hypothetical protein